MPWLTAERHAMIDRYRKLIFIDLETTGPNSASDRITEIGIVEVDADGVRRWSTLVNPEVPIPPFIRHLTGISDDMVCHAPTFCMVQEELLHRLQDGLFIAHNARFDYGFLRNAFKRLGETLRCEVLCTVKLSRKLFPYEMKHSLDALVERHGLSADARHRALADADLLWQFWRKLEATVPAATMRNAAQELLQRPNLPAHIDPDLLDDIPDSPGVYIFYGEHGVPLHVGRAAHLRQRVLSHFHSDRPAYKDASLARQLRHLDWHETAGEAGAQLLEVRLKKALRPVHDAAGDQQDLCAWQLHGARATLVFASELDFGRADKIHGMFTSRKRAEKALRALAEQHGLCPALLGFENALPGAACSAFQANRCRGACAGRESHEEHRQRLEQALASLRIQRWPYDGPAALIESGANGRQDVHLVDNWSCIGTAHSEDDVRQLLEQAPSHPSFDIDTYRIVSRALKLGKLRVRSMEAEVRHLTVNG